MKDRFIDYFLKFRILSKEEKEAITKDIKIGNFKKGTVLLREGQRPYDNYFILKGCVRQYNIKNGEEKITNFYTEEDWILPAIGQPNAQLSRYFLECVEDSVLVIGNENEGNELMKTNPKFLELSQMILEKEIMKQQQQFVEYQNSTPEERYLKLQETRPDLMARIPQYQLSSYIGVKPESLSRIRKRIAEKSGILKAK